MLKEETKPTPDKIVQTLRHTQIMLNVMPDFKFYILVCAAFSPEIEGSYQEKFDLIKEALITLQTSEGTGMIHLFQSIVQFFVKRCPDQKPHASELCMIMYNESMIEDQFFIAWHAKKAKTDKTSILYDHKSEKQFRGLLDSFIEWLQSGEYDDEADYGEEEDKKDDDEEEKKDDDQPEETEAQK